MHQPEKYERHKSLALRDAEFFAPLLVNGVPWGREEVIVDYGCGAGSTGARFILPLVRKSNSRMLSIDISSEMIEYAELIYPDPDVKYFVGDIMKNPSILGLESVDKIFSVYTFNFVNHQRELFQRMANALKAGGYLAFTMLSKISYFHLIRFLGKHPKWGQFLKGYKETIPYWVGREYDPHRETEEILMDCGFAVERIETHKLFYDFKSFDTLIGLYMSVTPFFKNLPEFEVAELRKEYCKFLLEAHSCNGHVDGNSAMATVKYETIYAVARKI